MKLTAAITGIVGALLMSAGCANRSTAPANANAPASAPAGSAASSDPSGDPRQSIMRAFKKQLDLASYRIKIQTTSSGTGPRMTIAEFVAPDRFHWSTDGVEMIVIGPTAYTKSGGTWTKSPANLGNLVSSFRDPKFLEQLSESADVKYLGTDVVDGINAQVYEYSLNNALGMKMTSSSKSWIRATDGLPLKVESVGEVNGMKTKSLLTYYDFNANIRIEPPI